MNNFDTLLTMMTDLQVSIFTVEMLREQYMGKWADTHHIVVPDSCESVIDYAFVRLDKDAYTLIYATHIDIPFAEALSLYTAKTLKCAGARFTLHSL